MTNSIMRRCTVVSAPAVLPPLFLDTFAPNDNSPLGLHAPTGTPGGSWNNVSGTGWVILNGATPAWSTPSVVLAVRPGSAAWPDDYEVHGTFASTDSNLLYLVARCANGVDGYYLTPNYLAKKNGNDLTQLGSAFPAGGALTNYTLRVRGDRIQAIIDGVIVTDVIDSTSPSGSPGVGGSYFGALGISSFSVDAV